MPFRGFVYELGTCRVSCNVVGRKVIDEGGSATDKVATAHSGCLSGDHGLPIGSHGDFRGYRSLCLLGSLSLYRIILKVTLCDYIHIKISIIQAGFIIMCLVLLYLCFFF